jgi:hypothetical protein
LPILWRGSVPALVVSILQQLGEEAVSELRHCAILVRREPRVPQFVGTRV